MRLLFLVLLLALAAAGSADARVPVPDKALLSMGFGNCNAYTDGCKWASNLSGDPNADAIAEASYLAVFKDGAAMGVDAFGYDATSNNAAQPWRLTRMSNAMRKYNNENPTAKKCIFIIYEAAANPLAMFNAADANGADDSPYCTVDGKPLIGAWATTACINPLPGLTKKGPFVMIGTQAHNSAGKNLAGKSCVNTWKDSGASKVLNYLWISGNMNLVKSYAASKTAATDAGSEFVMGIPSARANQCGSGCTTPRNSNYLYRDAKGFMAALKALRAPLDTPGINRMMLTMGLTGDIGEDSGWNSAEVCDANDTVPHNKAVDGINPGFTCPNVPSHMRGTIPMGSHYRSYINKSFTKRGFNRIARSWVHLFKDDGKTEPPFIAWAYREHPFSINASTFAICPTVSATVDGNSLDGTTNAKDNNLFLTSDSPDPVKVRVKIGSTTVDTYTLPAHQYMLTTDARQTVIPFGANRGRPTFEILDANNNVTMSVQGEVEYTDTPKQRDGTLGRNYSIYADYADLAQTQTTVSVSPVTGSIVEGNTGTTEATFRATLNQPTGTAVRIHWSVSSTAATPDDFGYAGVMPSGDTAVPAAAGYVDIPVRISGDTLAEPDEPYDLTITSPDATVVTATATGTILNDDGAARPTLSVTGPAGPVDKGYPTIFTLRRSGDLSVPDLVRWAIVPDTAAEDNFPPVFDDEFDGSAIDSSLWCVSSTANDPAAGCVTPPSAPLFGAWDDAQVTVGSGLLNLGMLDTAGDWTAGQVVSKAAFQGGLLRYRLTIPSGTGSYMTVWRQPDAAIYGPQPRSGTIADLVYFGAAGSNKDRTWQSEIHYSGPDDTTSPMIAGNLLAGGSWAGSVHEGETRWLGSGSGTQFSFRADGDPFWSPTAADWPATAPWSQPIIDEDGNPTVVQWPGGDIASPIDQPFHIVLQSGVGSSSSVACTGEVACPAAGLSGASMQFDWIRYYQYPVGETVFQAGQDVATDAIQTAANGVTGDKAFRFVILSSEASDISVGTATATISDSGGTNPDPGEETYSLDFGKGAGGFTDSYGTTWQNGNQFVTGGTEIEDTSSAGAWTSSLEAPPTMAPGYVTVSDKCPFDGDFPANSTFIGKDVKFIWPTDRECIIPFNSTTMKVTGKVLGAPAGSTSGNIWSVGGVFRTKATYKAVKDNGSGMLNFSNYSGATLFVEGAIIDSNGSCTDAIRAYGGDQAHKSRLVIQNTIAMSTDQCDPGGHGDNTHAQGEAWLSEIKWQNFNGRPRFQGLFFPERPNGHGADKGTLDHVLMEEDPIHASAHKPGGGAYVFFGPGNDSTAYYPVNGVSFDHTYLDWFTSHNRNNKDDTDKVIPNPTGFDQNGCAVYAPSVRTAAKITGTWCRGMPPGKFVPEEMVGLNYDRNAFTSGGGPITIAGARVPKLDTTRLVGSSLSIEVPVDTTRGRSRFVTLGFSARDETAAGQRVFGISGDYWQPNFDIFSSAGARDTEAIVQFPVTIGSDGKLRLTLTGVTGQAQINWMTISRPTIGVSLSKARYDEGEPIDMVFRREGPAEAPVSMAWRIIGNGSHPADAADFGGALPSGSISLGVGQMSGTQRISSVVDALAEPDEGFSAVLTGGVGADISAANARASATIAANAGTGGGECDDTGALQVDVRMASGSTTLLRKGALLPSPGVFRNLNTKCTRATVCYGEVACGDPKGLHPDNPRTPFVRVQVADDLAPRQTENDAFYFDVCTAGGACQKVKVNLLITGRE